jgi:hypothetical protein
MSRSSRTREPEVYTLFATVTIPPYSGYSSLHCGLIRPPRSRQYFTTAEFPPEYRDPQKGDPIRLELRLERLPRNKRRTWTLTIVGWPSLEREFLHDQLGYDS